MNRKQIKKMVKAVRPNYRKVKNVYYYSLGFYKDQEIPEFYKGGLTDNIPKRLYDLRSYVQKRGYSVDFEQNPHIFKTWKSAKKFEKIMLDKTALRTESPFGYFNGHTELFNSDPLEYAYKKGLVVDTWDEYWDNFDEGTHHPAWGLAGWLFE